MKDKPGKKRDSKGKRHPLHAESLDEIAEAINKYSPSDVLSVGTLVRVLMDEAKRVRKIVR